MPTVKNESKIIAKGSGKEYKRMYTKNGEINKTYGLLEHKLNIIDDLSNHSDVNKKYLTKENELEYLINHTQLMQCIVNANSIEELDYIKDKGLEILNNILNPKYS